MGLVSANVNGTSYQTDLMVLMPRLRRFAGVLANCADERDRLLRAACETIAENSHRRQSGMAFDRWAFSEIHTIWLRRLRKRNVPIAQGLADDRLFIPQGSVGECDHDVAAFLGGLPPQQRVVMLLVYGEGYSQGETAETLDTPLETIAQRAARGLAGLADRLDGSLGATAHQADIQPPYSEKKRVRA